MFLFADKKQTYLGKCIDENYLGSCTWLGNFRVVNDMTKIDFVIPWVDGQNEEHIARRKNYQAKYSFREEDKEQTTSNDRFFQYNELKFALRSIKRFAPWYNRIFILTDKQCPSFLNINKLSSDRIYLVDHVMLFQNRPEVLPTFNSRAIASVLHHLEDLSEFFVCGNDDIFLGSEISPSYFFQNSIPVIYGDWCCRNKDEAFSLHQQGMLNAASIIGFNEQYIRQSHGFQPMRKSFNAKAESLFPSAFDNNTAHRFRHRSQFLTESLMNHYLVKYLDQAVMPTTSMVHFSFEMCRIASREKIEFLFSLFRKGERKMMCINEYHSLYRRISDIEYMLNDLCGPPLESERKLGKVGDFT